jgi:hypothetical protein
MKRMYIPVRLWAKETSELVNIRTPYHTECRSSNPTYLRYHTQPVLKPQQ